MATSSRGARLLPRLTLSALLSAALIVVTAAPGFANRSQVPDGGERPSAVGEVPLPDGSMTRPPAANPLIDGPLAAEIAELEIEIEAVEQQLELLLPEVGPAGSAAEYADELWRTAVDELANAQDALDDLVDASFRGAAALPPALYRPQLPGLSAHAPLPVEAPLGARGAALNLASAKEAEASAAELRDAALEAEENLTDLRVELEAELSDLQDQLAELHDRNAAQLAERERAREAAQQEGAADRYPDLAPVDGFEAHEDAVRAVRFALNQLGKPYQWGAQGPDRYDCSGLMWAAYRSVGQQLPRVAADQFQGTQGKLITRSAAVAQSGLLPGDLVFFSSGPNWQSIHHVGMYVGNGQMVHAPNRNEVVKVSPVWWSRFFGATRVIDAVPADGATPSPTPPPGGSSPTPRPTPGPTATSIPPTSRPPSSPPTTPPTPSPTSSPTPSPTPPSPSPEPTDDPPASPPTNPPDSPTASPGPTESASSPD